MPLTAFNRRSDRRDGRQGICRECYRTKVHQEPDKIAKARARALDYQARFPEKQRARKAMTNALKSGRLVRPDCCEHCGVSSRLDGHHHNGYDDPFDVQWLCRSCHVTLEPRRGVAA